MKSSRQMQTASVATGLFSMKLVDSVGSDCCMCAVMPVVNPGRGHKDKLWLHREAKKAMTATEMP